MNKLTNTVYSLTGTGLGDQRYFIMRRFYFGKSTEAAFGGAYPIGRAVDLIAEFKQRDDCPVPVDYWLLPALGEIDPQDRI